MTFINYSYSDLISIEYLFQAWSEFIKGKKTKIDILTFERYLEDNLFELYFSLKNKTYRHGDYKSFYVRDPKMRHISKACVRDRIVHHLTGQVLERVFESTFYAHSYSCRRNRGTHKGVEAFIKIVRKASKNNSSSLFVLKCDIKKFFATIDHKILFGILSKKIKDKDFLWLLSNIISSFKSEYTIDPKEPKGMPIGNLTSQFFCNIYMNQFDKFIKDELKIKYYIRYADDFVVLSKNKEFLENLIPKLKKFFLENLKLTMHPDKIVIRDYYLGIDFLGYVIFPHFILPRTKTKKRIFRKLQKKVQLVKTGEISIESLNQSFESYLGYLSHADAYKLSQKLKNLIVTT